MNIAQDGESFKAIKGNTRLYKAKVIIRKQKQGHSFLLAKAYERSHTTYFILRPRQQSLDHNYERLFKAIQG